MKRLVYDLHLVKMVKLFIGNLPPEATPAELKTLFEQYGKVTECDIITNYGFVHMEDKKSADQAVENLNQYELHSVCINVEHSRGKPKASTKLHVSSLSTDCTGEELREKFEQYGTVLECDIVKDFAFVHMEKAEEALEAIRNLNNHEFKGSAGPIGLRRRFGGLLRSSMFGFLNKMVNKGSVGGVFISIKIFIFMCFFNILLAP
ncbi:RNA-binding protein 4B-like isoform X3 [Rhinoderma darwinii]|uniref:RNA-binding protein 4B-like isoform X3 n=1 Tax=Rhinoderma darwinii TaxID=43563 RepID=UPI003F669988